MNDARLRENRRHGTAEFPLAVYRMEQGEGEPILDFHWHEETEFLWVESGRAAFQVGMRAYELEAGEGVFVPPGALHGGVSLNGSPCTYMAVVFDLMWLTHPQDGLSARYLLPLQRGQAELPAVFARRDRLGRTVLRRLARICRLAGSADPARDFAVKAELYAIFAAYAAGGNWSRPGPAGAVDARALERLKNVLSYIERHYAEKLTIRQLAAEAGLSAGHFSRLFKTYMRRTPIEYVIRCRIREAARLLAETGWPVGEVAGAVGFDHFGYFSRRFREVYQCSPSEYRKRI